MIIVKKYGNLADRYCAVNTANDKLASHAQLRAAQLPLPGSSTIIGTLCAIESKEALNGRNAVRISSILSLSMIGWIASASSVRMAAEKRRTAANGSLQMKAFVPIDEIPILSFRLIWQGLCQLMPGVQPATQ
jgi:hypothetical protein